VEGLEDTILKLLGTKKLLTGEGEGGAVVHFGKSNIGAPNQRSHNKLPSKENYLCVMMVRRQAAHQTAPRTALLLCTILVVI
jgi:hypothetical protein